MCGCPLRPEEDIGFPVARVTGGCKPPTMGAGTELGSLGRTGTLLVLTPASISPPVLSLHFLDLRNGTTNIYLSYLSQSNEIMETKRVWKLQRGFLAVANEDLG